MTTFDSCTVYQRRRGAVRGSQQFAPPASADTSTKIRGAEIHDKEVQK